MKVKRLIIYVLCTIILFALFSLGMSYRNPGLNLKVRIFQIPPHQSITKILPSPPAKEGEVTGIYGERIGGNVTATFPNGIVLLETDLFQSNDDLIREIKEKVSFCCEKVLSILPVAEEDMLVDEVSLFIPLRGGKIYRQRNSHLYVDYSLGIQPLSIQDEEAILKIRFSAKYKVAEGDKKKLLDQTFGLKYSRTLIVGFPTNGNHRRGTVYWLALSFEDK